jgi:chromosome segregation ATPase
MSDLETRLAEARKRLPRVGPGSSRNFDEAAAIAREVVAEKDAEIANWETEARRLHDLCDEKDAEIERLFQEVREAYTTALTKLVKRDAEIAELEAKLENALWEMAGVKADLILAKGD